MNAEVVLERSMLPVCTVMRLGAGSMAYYDELRVVQSCSAHC